MNQKKLSSNKEILDFKAQNCTKGKDKLPMHAVAKVLGDIL